MLWMAAMYNILAILSMADMVCLLACMQKLWSSCAVMGLYTMYGIWTVYVGVYVMLQNFIAAEHSIGMDQWKTGVNNAEYLHLVCTNRLCACRDVV